MVGVHSVSEHYFSKSPQIESSPKSWSYSLRGKIYKFTSDFGVFSKNEVDFGSRELIEAFEEPPVSGDILDLGCGYGPIGISIAGEFLDRKVVMVDVNQRALSLAEENAKQNGVSNIELIESDRFKALANYRFAAILTNPPIRAGKNVVHAMLEESYRALLPEGELWVVIQKKQGAPSAKKKLEEQFDEVEVVAKNKGYFIFKAKKV